MANGYTFTKSDGAAVITHTDGRAWGTTEGATIRWEPSQGAYKIDFNTVDLTFSLDEIISIADAAPDKDGKSTLKQLLKIFSNE